MKTIPFSMFNVYERYLMLQLVERILEKKQEALPELSTIFQTIHNLRVQLEKSIHKSNGSEFTQLIHDQDEVQDQGFVCFRTKVEAQGHSIIDLELREKSMTIQKIIRRHGWSLMKFGNKKQLVVSLSLIEELSLPENMQLLADMDVINEFNAWAEAVKQFENLFIQKTETEAAGEDLIASNELGKQAVELLDKVLPGWMYQSEFGNNPAYGELMNAIMEGAEDLEVQARSRSTRKQNMKEE